MKTVILSLGVTLLLSGCHPTIQQQKELLGRQIFFDHSLSEPSGVACVTCHRPEKGFADTLSRTNSEGAVKGLFAKRNSMTISYAAFVPPLRFDNKDSVWLGGLFWNGRVNDLAHQADMPFVDVLEMRNENAEMVVRKIKRASYFEQMQKIYDKCDSDEQIYAAVIDALTIYQQSDEVNPFSSRFDHFLAGKCSLTEQEKLGYELFQDQGQCSQCHIIELDTQAGRPLFTDYTYDNLGVPANPQNNFYRISSEHNPDSTHWVDWGLGEVIAGPEQRGKFRVPTLRNIALTAPYAHNGYFRTLEDIVHFYNVRDVTDEYPVAEYPENVNKEELGNLGLTPEQEQAIVAFMMTLTDGYVK